MLTASTRHSVGHSSKTKIQMLTIEVGCVGKRGCRRITLMALLNDRALKHPSRRRRRLRVSLGVNHHRRPSSFHHLFFRFRASKGLVGSLSASEV